MTGSTDHTESKPCSICGLPLQGVQIGTGDGTMKDGGSFAHGYCYYRDRAQRWDLDNRLLKSRVKRQRAELRQLNKAVRFWNQAAYTRLLELQLKDRHIVELQQKLRTMKNENPPVLTLFLVGVVLGILAMYLEGP